MSQNSLTQHSSQCRAAHETVTCSECGAALQVWTQTTLSGTIEQAHCDNPDCDLYHTTMSPAELAALTPEQVAAYRAMNARMRYERGVERINLFIGEVEA